MFFSGACSLLSAQLRLALGKIILFPLVVKYTILHHESEKVVLSKTDYAICYHSLINCLHGARASCCASFALHLCSPRGPPRSPMRYLRHASRYFQSTVTSWLSGGISVCVRLAVSKHTDTGIEQLLQHGVERVPKQCPTVCPGCQATTCQWTVWTPSLFKDLHTSQVPYKRV